MASKEQDNPSGFSITFPPKQRKLVKCIICQVDKDKILRKGKESSIDTFNRALNLRKDEVYDRLHKDVPNFLNQDVFGIPRAIRPTPVNTTYSMLLAFMKAKRRVKLVVRKHAEFQGRQLVSI